MTKKQNHIIQPFRFRLNPEALKNRGIVFLAFPWKQQLDNFIENIKVIRSVKWLSYSELPPWSTLNTAFSLSAFAIHPFAKRTGRRAMFLGNIERPSGKKIVDLSRRWLRWYILDRFEKEMEHIAGQDAYKRLMDEIQWSEQWQERDAMSLISPSNMEKNAYQAIPSLVANLLAERSISYRGRTVDWDLSQDRRNNRLGLVSQPIPTDRGKGHFAIHLSFAVHSIPGDPDPFIDIGVHLRRYQEKEAKNLGKNDNTVMVKTGAPWIVGWPEKGPVRIPVSISGYKPSNSYYRGNLPEFLEFARIRSLVDSEKLLLSPQSYWQADDDTGDQYFALYREGILPDHPLETGYSMGDLQRIYSEICRITEDVLVPVPELKRDLWNYGKMTPMEEVNIWDFLDRKTFSVIETDRKTVKPTEHEKRNLLQTALKKAAPGKDIRLCVFYHSELTRDLLEHFALELLGKGTPIVSTEIPQQLVSSLLDESNPVVQRRFEKLTRKEYRENEKAFEKQLKIARRERVKACRRFLQGAIGEAKLHNAKSVFLALIELSGQRYSLDKLDPKGALREGFIAENVHSQFINPIEEPIEESLKNKSRGLYRARNAISDLVIRQTGAIYGDIENFYKWIGVPHSLYDELTLIGLYRLHKNNPKIDYSVVVRVRPDLGTEILLPEPGRQWLPYLKGIEELGNVFREAKSNSSKYNSSLRLSWRQTQQLIARICTETKGNRILFVVAQQFRSSVWENRQRYPIWEQLLEDSMERLELNLISGKYHPEDLEGLRVIRLREQGILRETPQYVRVDTHSETKGLYPVKTTIGGFPIYYSLGDSGIFRRQRADVSKTDIGAGMAFKHSRLLEIVPFFWQHGDKPEDLARLAHTMRRPLHWTMGHVSFPWSIHLARKSLDDLLDIFD